MASAIPLTDINGELLPLQFCVDPGNAACVLEVEDLTYSQKIDLLTAYLDVIRIDPSVIIFVSLPKFLFYVIYLNNLI